MRSARKPGRWMEKEAGVGGDSLSLWERPEPGMSEAVTMVTNHCRLWKRRSYHKGRETSLRYPRVTPF